MFVSAFFPRNYLFVVGILLLVLAIPPQVYAQYVDCSGNDPYAFPSITAALATAGPGSWITVVGTCNENVYISNLNNIGISALWQQTAAINGMLSIQNSENVNLYGLNVTNAAGDGIQVGNSRSVILDTCSGNGNAGKGMTIGPTSDVNITTAGSFSNNGDTGITLNARSSLQILAWGGSVTISGNKNAGIYASTSYVEGLGNIVIENTSGSTANGLVSGFGIDLRGQSILQMGTIFGSNVIQNNHSGGVSLQENVEASFWGGPTIIANGAL